MSNPPPDGVPSRLHSLAARSGHNRVMREDPIKVALTVDDEPATASDGPETALLTAESPGNMEINLVLTPENALLLADNLVKSASEGGDAPQK